MISMYGPMTVAVMDYSQGKIKIYKIPASTIDDHIDVEDWLLENTDYKESTCYYMTNTGEIPVEHM